MKKALSVVALLVFICALCACGASKPTPTGVTFTVPEGFQEMDVDGYQMWCSPNYPDDGSNVNYMTFDAVSKKEFSSQSKESYAASIENEYKNSGYDVDVAVTNYKEYDIDGWPVIRVDSSYELNGIAIDQISVSINADKLHTITYTGIGLGWMDVYEDSIATIALTY